MVVHGGVRFLSVRMIKYTTARDIKSTENARGGHKKSARRDLLTPEENTVLSGQREQLFSGLLPDLDFAFAGEPADSLVELPLVELGVLHQVGYRHFSVPVEILPDQSVALYGRNIRPKYPLVKGIMTPGGGSGENPEEMGWKWF
jgi:hypothetical protein